MKALICILSFVLISNTCLSQKDSTLLKNQLDLDLHLLSAGANYKHFLTKKIAIGVNANIGVSLNISDKNYSNYGELYSTNLFIDYYWFKHFHTQLGIRHSATIEEYNSDNYQGVELGLYCLIDNIIEVGFKPHIIKRSNEYTFGIPFFLIRFRLKKW